MGTMPGLIVAIFFIAIGAVLIVGTYKRWDWLVDPPDKYWMAYSHSFMKKLFGKTFLIYFNYILGAILIALSLLGIVNGITNK